MGRRDGFTLVELIIAISIIALLFSVSLSAAYHFQDFIQLDSSAKQMATEVRKTQMRAMARGETSSFKRFKFSKSGFTAIGGSGTELLRSRRGKTRKIIVSSAGRVRVE